MLDNNQPINNELSIKSEYISSIVQKEKEAHFKAKKIFNKISYKMMMDNINNLSSKIEKLIKFKKLRKKN